MSFIKSRKHPAGRSLPFRNVAGATLTAASVLGGQASLAQSSSSGDHLPTVEVQAAPEFKTDESASTKFTAPLIDTPRTVSVIPQAVI